MKRCQLRGSGISVMFMTFIAVSILTLIFLSYYLHLTQQSLSASEAQRIYAEAAQENLDAFYYPPAGEASSQGISQTLVIQNRGIGAVIKYIFIKRDQSLGGPINGGDIVLRSGESIRLQPAQPIPDGAEILIVTERGSTFTARQGYFNILFIPERLVIYKGEEGVSALLITSNNYESRLKVDIRDSDIGHDGIKYEVIGDTEFYITRNGIHSITISVTAQEEGTYRLSANVSSAEYFKTATLDIKVIESVVPGPYFRITLNPSEIEIPRGKSGNIAVIIESVSGYSGNIMLSIESVNPSLPPGQWDYSFNPKTVFVPPDGSVMSTLTITIKKTAPTGTFYVTIRGTDQDGIYREAILTLIITP